MRRTTLVVLAAVVTGFVAGYLLRGRENVVHDEVARRTPASLVTARAEPQATLARPAATEARDELPAPAPANDDTVDLMQTLLRMQKEHLLDIHVDVMGFNHHLTPAVKTLLHITDGEAAVLDREADRVVERLKGIEVERATSRVEDGKLTISVPAFPTEGGKLYDELVATYARTLGPERNELIQQLAGANFDTAFNGFGLGSRVLTVEHTPADSDFIHYIVKDVRRQDVGLDGTPSSFTSQGGGQFHGREDMLSIYGALIGKNLPPDF